MNAAGRAAPIATLVLVAVMIFGALPVYKRVAGESPHGMGSIAMLERLLPRWNGKLFVLALLGFAFTGWVITITLSASDAAAHLVENPSFHSFLAGKNLLVTLLFIAILGAVFLRGFNEAIGIAVVLVAVYLILNAVVIVTGLIKVSHHTSMISTWHTQVSTEHGSGVQIVLFALSVFPLLALGMSGFETGVAVMPLITGDPGETEEKPLGRIRNARKLLAAAAIIMSVYLIGSSVVCSLLIPESAFGANGPANGRALAFLAHGLLGNGFGTFYDISTVLILWFAGASAMAGMLTLAPRYLPRYGMAPGWIEATRPLVVVIIAACFLITWIFDANTDAQGGAYATGVLVLMTSATVAVTISAYRRRQRRLVAFFAFVAGVFVYTTVVNIVKRVDGLKIGICFIIAIVITSIASRMLRAFELRTTEVVLDASAKRYIRDSARRTIRLVANEPDNGDAAEYRDKIAQIMDDNEISNAGDLIFVEVTVTDPSDFDSRLEVRGSVKHDAYRVLTMESPSVPNALAALVLHIRDATETRPHIYFEWTEGNPARNFLRFLLFGAGEVAPVTREVLRRAEPARKRRP
ncbi:MAG TPA: amino acid transporter, partial [Marmoricola sp.]|nr:amino acid transporter [Marmoricola sp.]